MNPFVMGLISLTIFYGSTLNAMTDPAMQGAAQQPTAQPSADAGKQGQAAPAMGDATAAAAQAGPEVKAEQLKWPDTIELTEKQAGLSGGPAMKALMQSCDESLNQINQAVTAITQTQSDVLVRYTDISNQLKEFYQMIGFQQGQIEKMFEGPSQSDGR